MKSLCWRMLSFVLFMLMPVFAMAQELPAGTPEAEGMKMLPAIIDAVVNGKWVLLGAMVVMIATLFVRQYAMPKWGLPAQALPFVSAGLAALYGIGAKMIAGMEVGDAALLVLLSGGLASQLWDAGGKYLLKLILGDKYVEAPPAPVEQLEMKVK